MDEMDLSFHWLFSEISFIPFQDWSSNELLCLKIAYYLPGKKSFSPINQPKFGFSKFSFSTGISLLPEGTVFYF